MKNPLTTIWAIALLGNSFAVYAYDPVTHSDMSEKAFEASVLSTDTKTLAHRLNVKGSR